MLEIDGKKVSPWDLMQSFDADRFGADIFDPKEQARWCRAILIGGLPYMWRIARPVLDEIYRIAEIEPGHKVLLFGEALESCGFIDDVNRLVGPGGEVTTIDIQQYARDMSIGGVPGKNGIIGTFPYDFFGHLPEESFDVVLNLQAIEHAEDWTEAGERLLRVLKPGRRLVMAEIFMVTKELPWKIKADLHIQHLIDKIFAGIGRTLEGRPYYSHADLRQAFDWMLTDTDHFEWRGLEAFWGRKP
ncbi:class I SAM-dependent methyltransferase [Chelativorans salis]|uniref:Methyltransferase domain-containing protein n=1 Tax=Chelativorans salis TaxID=2978478 RepID=A0ABT2LW74_9HYPH|nr:methyltransferase domain-containing protein [Chelativorans sp. EGI FJ00035]MCT7378132.1 methyltransferase domain-containing protein [Chelativorans sp. EGI FJ00035]